MSNLIIPVEKYTKAKLGALAQQMADEVIEHGTISASEMYAQGVALEMVGKNLRTALQQSLQDEMIGKKESTVARSGVKFYLKEVPKKSYDHCPAWVAAKAELDRIKKMMDAIETPVADTDTGEIIQPVQVRYTQNVIQPDMPKE